MTDRQIVVVSNLTASREEFETTACNFDGPKGCTALLCYDQTFLCNVRMREKRNVGIIKQFADIEATGDLPEGFSWDTIIWQAGKGWKGYIRGPDGATNWLKVQKLPKEVMAMVEELS